MTTYNPKNRLALLASGNGTNVQNFINYFRIHYDITIALVVSDNPFAYALKRAEIAQIPHLVIDKNKWKDEEYVLGVFKEHGINFVVLAGYLSLIPPYFIKAYPKKIVNIHPALLPKYGGKGMYGMNVHKAVMASGDSKSGISIHYVNEEYDQGRVIFQAACKIFAEDTPESLEKKVRKLELLNYPRVVEGLM
ncbi:MAG: phosphoribosylglycinamide formyltransferase [Bacteroidetes bacterium]|nr:phosphoribosylglycinamide formyltransferase [Bacteroidota bacterium]